VAHRDLDLRTAAGTKALDRRIWRAVVEVCGTAPDFDIAGKNDVRACRRDTRALASAQADVVVANASRGEPIRVSSIRK
jgi:UrcA family protein